MPRLAGKVAIVTGGALGIGRHYVQALAAEGVVDAELDDHDLGLEPERPVDPAEAAGGGVAGHADRKSVV